MINYQLTYLFSYSIAFSSKPYMKINELNLN